jgi:NTP pyrophosphatase (non-canonical NTP hydrolase)
LRRNRDDFAQFQSPKNLALSISLEAAELLEHFQWTTEDQDIPPDKREAMAEEVADILISYWEGRGTAEVDFVKSSCIAI